MKCLSIVGFTVLLSFLNITSTEAKPNALKKLWKKSGDGLTNVLKGAGGKYVGSAAGKKVARAASNIPTNFQFDHHVQLEGVVAIADSFTEVSKALSEMKLEVRLDADVSAEIDKVINTIDRFIEGLKIVQQGMENFGIKTLGEFEAVLKEQGKNADIKLREYSVNIEKSLKDAQWSLRDASRNLGIHSTELLADISQDWLNQTDKLFALILVLGTVYLIQNSKVMMFVAATLTFLLCAVFVSNEMTRMRAIQTIIKDGLDQQRLSLELLTISNSWNDFASEDYQEGVPDEGVPEEGASDGKCNANPGSDSPADIRKEVQTGKVLLGMFTGQVIGPQGVRFERILVKFPEMFERVPDVTVSMNALDSNIKTDTRVRFSVLDISVQGFMLQLEALGDCFLGGAGATWIASSKSTVPVGSIPFDFKQKSLTAEASCKHVAFRESLAAVPNIWTAIRNFEVKASTNIHIETYAEGATKEGFYICTKSSDNSQINALSVAWLASVEPGIQIGEQHLGISDSCTDQDKCQITSSLPGNGEATLTIPRGTNRDPLVATAISRFGKGGIENHRVWVRSSFAPDAHDAETTSLKVKCDVWATSVIHFIKVAFIVIY